MSEDPSISIEDFMELDEQVAAPQKVYTDEEYLAQLSTKQARNAAWIAEKLGVTPPTVVRRLSKDEVSKKLLTRYSGAEPFFVKKPEKEKKEEQQAKGVQL